MASGAIFFGLLEFLYGLILFAVGKYRSQRLSPVTAGSIDAKSKLIFAPAANYTQPKTTQWQVAVDHYPDLADIEARLEVISDNLASEFRNELLKSKAFAKRNEIAEEFENSFFTTNFGHNSEIVALGRKLIEARAKEAAQQLTQAIAVLGDTADINLLLGRFRKQFPQEPVLFGDGERVRKYNHIGRIASSLLKTQFVDDAKDLVAALSGKVSWQSAGFFEPKFLVLELRGQIKKFGSDYEMTQWVMREVAPAALEQARLARKAHVSDEEKGTQ